MPRSLQNVTILGVFWSIHLNMYSLSGGLSLCGQPVVSSCAPHACFCARRLSALIHDSSLRTLNRLLFKVFRPVSSCTVSEKHSGRITCSWVGPHRSKQLSACYWLLQPSVHGRLVLRLDVEGRHCHFERRVWLHCLVLVACVDHTRSVQLLSSRSGNRTH